MNDYYIRVYQEDDTFNEYDITTSKGDDFAILAAFLMDGGAGAEYEDDDGMLELAKTWTEIISVVRA